MSDFPVSQKRLSHNDYQDISDDEDTADSILNQDLPASQEVIEKVTAVANDSPPEIIEDSDHGELPEDLTYTFEDYIEVLSTLRLESTGKLIWPTPATYLKRLQEYRTTLNLRERLRMEQLYSRKRNSILDVFEEQLTLGDSPKSWKQFKTHLSGQDLSMISYPVPELVSETEQLQNYSMLKPQESASSKSSANTSKVVPKRQASPAKSAPQSKRIKAASLSAPFTNLPGSNTFTSCMIARTPTPRVDVGSAVSSILNYTRKGEDDHDIYQETATDCITPQNISYYEAHGTTSYTRDPEVSEFCLKMELFPGNSMVAKSKSTIWKDRKKTCFLGVKKQDTDLIHTIQKLFQQIDQIPTKDRDGWEKKTIRNQSFRS